MSKRKDFEPWKVELVYRHQDGTCKNCGKSIEYGYHRHHEDGNPANNSVGNLTLLCDKCHDAQAYKTYMKKKKGALGQIEAVIKKGIAGELSGAALDKLTDAVKLGLSLTEQIYGMGREKPPAAIRMENYLVSSGILLKEYEKGFREGVLKITETVVNQIINLKIKNKEIGHILAMIALQQKKKEKKPNEK